MKSKNLTFDFSVFSLRHQLQLTSFSFFNYPNKEFIHVSKPFKHLSPLHWQFLP